MDAVGRPRAAPPELGAEATWLGAETGAGAGVSSSSSCALHPPRKHPPRIVNTRTTQLEERRATERATCVTTGGTTDAPSRCRCGPTCYS